MSMFYYQCQETAKNTGCTVRGVCGKTEECSNLQDLLIYVCKGVSFMALEAFLDKKLEKLTKATLKRPIRKK